MRATAARGAKIFFISSSCLVRVGETFFTQYWKRIPALKARPMVS